MQRQTIFPTLVLPVILGAGTAAAQTATNTPPAKPKASTELLSEIKWLRAESVKVSTASLREESADRAPATVRVVTAQQIQERGYRTIRRGLALQYDPAMMTPDIQVMDVNLAGDRKLILHHKVLNRIVLENVAFGEPAEQVNQDRVWEALEAAQLQEFVAEMPYGLFTQVGENGLRLSGGQRQRLALARAFYRQANFLVLDEATSALDNRTESEVIEALEVIGRRCTTVPQSTICSSTLIPIFRNASTATVETA